jgi:hypothetical protein
LGRNLQYLFGATVLKSFSQFSNSPSPWIFWLKVTLVAALYLGLQVTILLITGVGWQKFWALVPLEDIAIWDTGHYVQLARFPSCAAFYPLWPAVVRQVHSSGDLFSTLRATVILSEGIFLGTLPLALWTFERIIHHRGIAFCMLVLFALGPNTIFQTIGYTEALFSALSLLFLLAMHQFEQAKSMAMPSKIFLLVSLFLLNVLQNLTRPVLVQSLFAVGFTLGVLILLRYLSDPATSLRLSGRGLLTTKSISLALVIAVSSLVGYSLYGWYCWRIQGSFWFPFEAQAEWDRTWGFRPLLLLGARSRFLDVLSLWVPLLLVLGLGALLWALYRRQSFQISLPRRAWVNVLILYPPVFIGVTAILNRFFPRQTIQVAVDDTSAMARSLGQFTVLYAIAFAGVHSLINFLYTWDALYSAARHYFGTPYAYVGIGAFLGVVGSPRVNRLAWGVAILGFILLGQQWYEFSYDRWLG